MYVIRDSPEPLSFSVRRADRRDAASIRNLAVASKIDAWTIGQYGDEVDRDDAIVLVATESLSMVGFIAGRVVPSTSEGNDAEIYNIAVDARSRGKGIGRKLLENAIDHLVSVGCRSVWLEVRESNQKAVQFYENNGFSRITIRRAFYSEPTEDAIVMRLTLVAVDSTNKTGSA